MTRNIKLTIEYDGSDYAGWQAQPNAPTVQAVIERALGTVLGEPTRVTGAGRTDAGVHARGQVANVRTSSTIPARGLMHALNATMPDDVAILQCDDVPVDFHARFGALSRSYEYTILNRDAPSALRGRYSWRYRRRIDVDVWDQLANDLLGTRDCSSFRKTGSQRRNPVCTVLDCSCSRTGDTVTLAITADAFLRGMVRAVVGTFVKVAPDDAADVEAARLALRGILAAGDRSVAGASVPPQGLCLVGVAYP
ncbi:tRNA pseudouridine(38-40) synthase TruA [Candidatus Poribacteria bacterium]|jgi:tRNA pseudouridine38-40 synthase|nr:tRNA pseudouridine(38-40) synthase TruA [Candidatus Poribacteria bacterium]MBT5533476.1 tRNA pseudouridine(38-40) synthase TruA [Candidatus Poribacteria bacterium]MBT5709801.1 tRNA pseudouridine(38-40) synthase TruA [Candidatus Poribacteria bacterium]MBT7101437.1 tRNA pseudouridine(38-40) synthase TruA [Candidatus Poribacteria bacterium]MBT7806444.1 tRNA pseudouridine(38-40) synthase TruA [Candidatus Poribacteria bacterium]